LVDGDGIGLLGRTDYPNKVDFAEWACSQLDGEGCLDVFDLHAQLERLVKFIRKASQEEGLVVADGEAGEAGQP
jgi:hypothetical protein